MLVESAVLACGGAAAAMAWAVRGRSSSVLAPSVWKGPAEKKALALTFDDGPSEGTFEVLELLEKYKAKGTFFQIGSNVHRRPSITATVAEAGHEVGNHSWSHVRFDFKSQQFMEEELARTQFAVSEATGVEPQLFRPPFGVRWFGLRAAQQRFGLHGVMWSTIALDWKLPARAVAERILKGACNGAIVCLHDGRELQGKPDISATLDALRLALPQLTAEGYELETVSNLIWKTNSRKE